MLFLPTSGDLQFTFANTITLAFDQGDVGMMSQTIEQRRDAGGVGEDGVPLLETLVGGQHDGIAFVSGG